MVNPVHYHDFAGLKNLETKASHQDPEAIKVAAQQFESMFINMVLKSMRDANQSFKSDMLSDQTQDFYQEMYDQQLSTNLSENNGIGLSEILVKQLSKNLDGKTP
jgi:flagellar protein FlgJ